MAKYCEICEKKIGFLGVEKKISNSIVCLNCYEKVTSLIPLFLLSEDEISINRGRVLVKEYKEIEPYISIVDKKCKYFFNALKWMDNNIMSSKRDIEENTREMEQCKRDDEREMQNILHENRVGEADIPFLKRKYNRYVKLGDFEKAKNVDRLINQIEQKGSEAVRRQAQLAEESLSYLESLEWKERNRIALCEETKKIIYDILYLITYSILSIDLREYCNELGISTKFNRAHGEMVSNFLSDIVLEDENKCCNYLDNQEVLTALSEVMKLDTRFWEKFVELHFLLHLTEIEKEMLEVDEDYYGDSDNKKLQEHLQEKRIATQKMEKHRNAVERDMLCEFDKLSSTTEFCKLRDLVSKLYEDIRK